ncbi:MAG: Plug domain-containing protein [Nostoc sp.]
MTDTPIRDIPASMQVIPQQVIKDQQITRLDEALRNVSGVTLHSSHHQSDTILDFAFWIGNRLVYLGFLCPSVAIIFKIAVQIWWGSPRGLDEKISKKPHSSM